MAKTFEEKLAAFHVDIIESLFQKLIQILIALKVA